MSAPKKSMDARELDRRCSDLLALKRHRSSKVRFKPPFDVPKKGLDWVPLALPLLESSAWAAMGVYEFRAIFLLTVEHARHHRLENGYLVVTYDQFQGRGIPRKHIKRTLDNLDQLGLIEIVHRGSARKDASRYRLTFFSSTVRGNRTEYAPPENDWIEDELNVLEDRRKPPKRQTRSSRKNSFTGGKSATGLVVKSSTSARGQPHPENAAHRRGNRAHSNGYDRSGDQVH
jgi:hypothetical protein